MEKISLFISEKSNKNHNATAVIGVNNELYKFVNTKEGPLVLKKTNRSSLKSNDFIKIEISIESGGSFQHAEAGLREAIAFAFSDLDQINKRLEEVPVVELFKSSNIVLG